MSRSSHAVGIALCLMLGSAACGPGGPESCPEPPPPVEIGTFPYHPLVYHLDLSILSYQLHGQSLVWPFDPYYEERAELLGDGRDEFMASVHEWAADTKGPMQAQASEGLADTRGPGSLVGLPNNGAHDPILYDYSRLHPWSSTIMNAAGTWTEYLTPGEITGPIRDVYVAYRPVGGADDEVTVDPIEPGRIDSESDARDVLIAFEGETGDKGEAGQPGSQSLMGFVLARHTEGEAYDVHITFRGSRSGEEIRAFFEALSTGDAKGNPDWITDLGLGDMPEPQRSDITTVGEVARGFGTSTLSALPAIFESLDFIASLESGSPTNIYVTGHSLGGALAQHFVSAVVMGDLYGPDGEGAAMPDALLEWPWTELKLITFSAPRAGDEAWAKRLTASELESDFWDAGLDPYDRDAIASTAPSLVPRLLDPDRPAAYRALISTDPVTSAVPSGGSGKPVGKTLYVNLGCGDLAGFPDPGAHEPEEVRAYVFASTGDPRTPEDAWNYLEMSELNPDRDDDEKGTISEFEKLRDAVLDYYAERDLYFDEVGFTEDFELMLDLD